MASLRGIVDAGGTVRGENPRHLMYLLIWGKPVQLNAPCSYLEDFVGKQLVKPLEFYMILGYFNFL